jgi:cell division protein ZapA
VTEPRKHTVRVSIAGEEYSIRTDAPAEHTFAVAEYVDGVLRSILSSGAVIESHRAAILAALQITDELFRERASGQDTTSRISALTAEAAKSLPSARRPPDEAP